MLFHQEEYENWTDWKADYLRYREYLSSRADTLPENVRAFALQDWYYNSKDPRCPHDSWLEELAIVEPATGERLEERSIEVRLRLLGAYHDGHLHFRYMNVRRYSLGTPAEYKSPPFNVGHGDFIVDEIRPSDSGFLEHEIEFSRGSRFEIECSDIQFEFRARSLP